MWEAIQHIGTPISLIAFISAIIAHIVLGRQKNKIELLKSLPEDKRWELLNRDFDGYNVTQDNLTREQKFELMKTVLVQKAEHRRLFMHITFIVLAIIAFIASAAVFLSPTVSPITDATVSLTTQPDQALKLVTIFGQSEDRQPRARIIDKSDNNILLNESFSKAKSQIRIVTELGNTWLLGENYQAFKDAINRGLDIKARRCDSWVRTRVEVAACP